MAEVSGPGPAGSTGPIGMGAAGPSPAPAGGALTSAVNAVAQDALAHLTHTLENIPNKLADGISKMEHEEAAGSEDHLNLTAAIQAGKPEEVEELEQPLIDETEETEEEGDESEREKEGDQELPSETETEEEHEGYTRVEPVDQDPERVDIKKPDTLL